MCVYKYVGITLCRPGYNYDKPGFSPGTGHFTQVVWKSSTHVACAVAKGKRGYQNLLRGKRVGIEDLIY